jgi:hypothetical protein
MATTTGTALLMRNSCMAPIDFTSFLKMTTPLAPQAGHTLAQCVVEPLHGIGLPRELVDGAVLRHRHHPCVAHRLLGGTRGMVPDPAGIFAHRRLALLRLRSPTCRAMTWRVVTTLAIQIHGLLAFFGT